MNTLITELIKSYSHFQMHLDSCIHQGIFPGKLNWETFSKSRQYAIYIYLVTSSGFPGGTSGKESACQRRRLKALRFNFWVRKNPWSRKWHWTPVFFPGTFLGQRSLAGYRPWGHTESDITERLSTHT